MKKIVGSKFLKLDIRIGWFAYNTQCDATSSLSNVRFQVTFILSDVKENHLNVHASHSRRNADLFWCYEWNMVPLSELYYIHEACSLLNLGISFKYL